MQLIELKAMDGSPAYVNPDTVVRAKGTKTGVHVEYLGGLEGFYLGELGEIVQLLTRPAAPTPPKYLTPPRG